MQDRKRTNSKKKASHFEQIGKKEGDNWLPDLDSNQDKLIQSFGSILETHLAPMICCCF